MATDAPLSRLVLRATSVADDLGYVALADLAHVFGNDADYRVIGGHMVTALVARWNLGAELYRETDDTDIGVPPIVIQNGSLINRLKAWDMSKWRVIDSREGSPTFLSGFLATKNRRIWQ